MSEPLLSLRDVEVAYTTNPVLRGVSLEIDAGEFVGLLGQNGAGKTTLLHACLGLTPLRRGAIALGGRPLSSLDRAEIARRAALLPQEAAFGSHFRVRDIVAMGRYAHRKALAPESPEDRATIDAAMTATALHPLAERRASELSGGERQRLLFARALAQDSPLLFLDEPIASLDLSHQLETLERVRERSKREDRRAALAALHDIGLAARFCDRLILLHDGEIALDGRPEDVLHSSVLERYFGVEGEIDRDPVHGLVVHARRPTQRREK